MAPAPPASCIGARCGAMQQRVRCSSACTVGPRPSAFGLGCRPLGAHHAPPAESCVSAVAAIDAATPLSSMVFAKFRTSACGAVSLSGGLATLLVSLCANPRVAIGARCNAQSPLSALPAADRMASRRRSRSRRGRVRTVVNFTAHMYLALVVCFSLLRVDARLAPEATAWRLPTHALAPDVQPP